MTDQWKTVHKEEERQRIINKIAEVLKEGLGENVEVNALDEARLLEAAKQFESAVFKKAKTKVNGMKTSPYFSTQTEYAHIIAERILKIKRKTMGASVALSSNSSSPPSPPTSGTQTLGSTNTNTSNKAFIIDNNPSNSTSTLTPTQSTIPNNNSTTLKPSLLKKDEYWAQSSSSSTTNPTTSRTPSPTPSPLSPTSLPPTTKSTPSNSTSNNTNNNTNNGSVPKVTFQEVPSDESSSNEKKEVPQFTGSSSVIFFHKKTSTPSAIAPPSSKSFFVPDADDYASDSDGEEEEIVVYCNEDEMPVKFRFAGKRIALACNLKSSLKSIKHQLWNEFTEKKKVEVKKTINDYIFRVDVDDYLIDEMLTLSTPYMVFCSRNNITPYFHLVEKLHYKVSLKHIGAIVGRPLCWSGEQDEADTFRKQMTRIRYNKYNNRAKNDTTIPSYFPPQFSVRLYLTSYINFKTMNCEATQTVAETMDIIWKNHGKFLEKELQKSIRQKDFVLKFRGLEEYLMDPNMKLGFMETFRTCLRKKQRIELVLMEKKSLPIKNWERLTDYYEQNKINSSPQVSTEDIFSDSGDDFRVTSSIWNCHKKFRIKINRLEYFHSDYVESFGFKPQSKSVRLYVTVQIHHIDKPIGELYRTEDCTYHGGNQPIWNTWLETIPYRDLPWAGVLHFIVWCIVGKKPTAIGWVNFPIINYRDCVSQGYKSLRLWTGKPDPRETFLDNYRDQNPPKLSFEMEVVRTPLCFTHEPDPAPDISKFPDAFSEDRDKLEAVFNSDPLYIPKEEDRVLLWRYRGYCMKHPRSVAKFVWSIPWGNADAVREAYNLLHHWPLLDVPANALELLKPRFIDKKIREYTVRNLQQLADTELADYLLQLVQALKHEIHHDSPLARFLLQRALLNRNQIGHNFFWYMKSEPYRYEYSERFEMLLEAYLRGCGTFREELFKQTSITDQLITIANLIKSTNDKKRKAVLHQELANIKFPPYFQVTISPTYMAKGLVLDKCKYMESKTMPLWLVFENIDPVGDPVYAILKAGDDLRQDQLTLQMISIMDKMWLKEGLDLKMVHYKCVATGSEVGWIEVVQNSVTTADIQKEAGGLSEIFNEKTIANWLRQHNRSELEYNIAVDNFIRSCAGCCVATYVLGIGDRHNDNIMINKTGHLFHIDFGKFLGNAQMFLNIKRDRAPFVFTPDMAYVMGGTNSEQFQLFTDLCCKAYNIIRQHADIFINLFAMMLSTGIPELNREEDLNYLREAFFLNRTAEEASKKFKKLINESLNTKAIQLNFAIHLLANAQ